MTIKATFYFIYLFEVSTCSDEVMMENRTWNEALQAEIISFSFSF